MMRHQSVSSSLIRLALPTLMLALLLANWNSSAQEKPAATSPVVADAAAEEAAFRDQIAPLLQKFCVRCHDAENMESGIRVDQLTAVPQDRELFLLKGIQQQIDDEAMPPEKETQPSASQRKTFSEWITRTIKAARARDTKRNGAVRRLTEAVKN